MITNWTDIQILLMEMRRTKYLQKCTRALTMQTMQFSSLCSGPKKKIDSCISAEAPSVIIEVDSIKEKRIDAVKSKGLEYRFVTEITKDNVDYVKEMLTFSKVRHLNGLKGNFEIADEKEYVA